MMKLLLKALVPDATKPDLGVIDRAIAVQLNQIKIINAAISGYAIQAKNRRAIIGLENQNIMDDSTAIDILPFDPDQEKVKCPLYDHLITRSECLDYSGSNADDCKSCYIGRATKKKMLPPVGDRN